ncbi:hypothetical protein TSUD_22400 [Trifolium subterraneum]|uniref:GST N-terminal domain-containing protein n=1 Tax=Trifolium subterraneum TaxID=3900 RepID=A0A2Z6MGV5_TRISU|nr:hypothetical protein TSUD_22400 [Trifolium subterraneum]
MFIQTSTAIGHLKKICDVDSTTPHPPCTICARGSAKRNILYQKTGHFQVPFLEDPNTGIEMFESAEIIDYIRATYTL